MFIPILFRVEFFLALGALILSGFGVSEIVVGGDASEIPVHMELSDLEAGTPLKDNHLKIGRHWRIYPASVCSFLHGNDAPEANTRLSYVIYPIVSESHPFVLAWNEFYKQYDGKDPKDIPPESIPNPQECSFSVLVKTKQFKTMGAIPTAWVDAPEVSGLVINQIESLSVDERKLIRDSFPHAHLSNVLILEDGREPTSRLAAILMIVGGVLGFIGSIILYMRRSTKTQLPQHLRR